ncbi:hypothetical protein HYN56_12655 [Flavobacterium crocinum]|uniref:Potassium channel domain-containing protein n=1 Tax=Flavobacterium crocinum TaxID=2183896 RepID=A0A2S1YLX3_9FLAO|nr:hypothetical protein [Flavobacterium crocinum]AWK05032.1 hypothetical protein HYN56_12655 [Flavobacterium crocinum]
MKNGPIYIISKFLIENLKYISIVEFLKFIAVYSFFRNSNNDKKSTVERYVVDFFILLKWLLILYAMKIGLTNIYFTIFTWYLIFTNLYTYFYHHIWDKQAMNTESFLIDRVRRRFITLILSIGFSNLCFAYLFRFPYNSEFTWLQNKSSSIDAMWFSCANSLTAEYPNVTPHTTTSYHITIIQLIISFVFLTLILGKTVPQTTSPN